MPEAKGTAEEMGRVFSATGDTAAGRAFWAKTGPKRQNYLNPINSLPTTHGHELSSGLLLGENGGGQRKGNLPSSPAGDNQ